MNQNKRKFSSLFLFIGLISFAIGFAIDNKNFSWAAIIFILLSLILGGRWMRPRRK